MDINEISKKTWGMIKSHKRYVLLVAVLLIFVIRGFFTSTTTTTTATASTYTVISGSIENTLKVLGTTKITNLQTLVFGTEGKVTKIYVKEGDKVKAGQLLAELDKKQLSISLSQQSLSIQNARINYDKLLNQYTDADIFKAQNDVNSAQSKLDIAKKDLQDLKSDVGNILQNTSSYVQTNTLNAKGVANDSKDILENIDKIFSFTPRNDTYANSYNKTLIQATTSVYYNNAKTYFDTATTALSLLNTQLSNISSSSTTTRESVQTLQNQEKTLLNALSTMMDNGINAVNNAMVGEGAISQSQINSWLSTLNSSNSKVLSHLSSANTDIQNFSNTSTDIQTKQDEVNTDEAQLQTLQQTLQDMENGPDSNTRTLQSNSIKQSQLSYQQTSQQLDNYQITAPFDGTIDAIGFKVGDTVSSNAGTSSYGITMSNPDIYEVTMLIDQIDIVKIDKGLEAEISFDAYPGYSATGAISTIDPTPVTSAGVVSYYANIAMTKGERKIYDGMSVTVNITIEKRDDVLIVPSTAIQTIKGITAIPVTVGGTLIPKTVVVGITDGINSEILSGLSLGDVISLTTYTASATATSSISTSGNSIKSDMGSSMGSMRALEGATSGRPDGGGTPPSN
ncbi:MAG: efflux RND transporter periplasmic adaptor subunit [Candidatus Absconditabacterales bacterium]